MFSFRRYFKLEDIGYKDIGKTVVHQVWNMTLCDLCCGNGVLPAFCPVSLFPFLTTLIGYLPIPGLLDFILSTMQRFLPEDAFNLMKDNIKSLFGNKKGGLLSLGFVLALWTSSNAITSIMIL